MYCYHLWQLVPQPKGKLGTEYISPSQLKQIAGRAGRMASKYEQGLVTAWQEVDLAYVRAVMQHDVPAMKTAGGRKFYVQICPGLQLTIIFPSVSCRYSSLGGTGAGAVTLLGPAVRSQRKE